MDADDDYTRAGVRPSALAPLPDHRHVNTPWWQELWRRHAHITTPLRARGLTCDIEFGLSAYIVRVPLPDNTVLIIGPPQEPATERPPGDPEGWVATREHPLDPSRFEVIYDSSPSDDPSTHQRPEARHGGSAEPLIEAIDHRLAQLGLLPTSELHARDLADAHDPSADPASTETAAEAALDEDLRLTHTAYGSAHDTDSTTERNEAQPSTTTATAAATACGDALVDLTDQLNGSDSHLQAASLLRQVLDPDAGVLARLADFFEAAAEKAKEAEEDDAFDLAHDLADAAVGARNLAEDLETADARMRTLTSITPASHPPLAPSRTQPLPPRALPTTPPRHTR